MDFLAPFCDMESVPLDMGSYAHDAPTSFSFDPLFTSPNKINVETMIVSFNDPPTDLDAFSYEAQHSFVTEPSIPMQTNSSANGYTIEENLGQESYKVSNVKSDCAIAQSSVDRATPMEHDSDRGSIITPTRQPGSKARPSVTKNEGNYELSTSSLIAGGSPNYTTHGVQDLWPCGQTSVISANPLDDKSIAEDAIAWNYDNRPDPIILEELDFTASEIAEVKEGAKEAGNTDQLGVSPLIQERSASISDADHEIYCYIERANGDGSITHQSSERPGGETLSADKYKEERSGTPRNSPQHFTRPQLITITGCPTDHEEFVHYPDHSLITTTKALEDNEDKIPQRVQRNQSPLSMSGVTTIDEDKPELPTHLSGLNRRNRKKRQFEQYFSWGDPQYLVKQKEKITSVLNKIDTCWTKLHSFRTGIELINSLRDTFDCFTRTLELIKGSWSKKGKLYVEAVLELKGCWNEINTQVLTYPRVELWECFWVIRENAIKSMIDGCVPEAAKGEDETKTDMRLLDKSLDEFQELAESYDPVQQYPEPLMSRVRHRKAGRRRTKRRRCLKA